MPYLNPLRSVCLCFSFCLIALNSVAAGLERETWGEIANETIEQSYQQINLTEFYNENQIPEQMVQKKQRLMLPPSAVQFDARLMSAPKPGQFSLVYDALGLWQQAEEADDRPEVTHSAFVGVDNGPVLGMYLSKAAAKQIQQYEVNSNLHLYAVHLYNYAGGPRLVVLGAEPVQ